MVVVPDSYFCGSARILALVMRLGLSFTYALDMMAQIALGERSDLSVRKVRPSVAVVTFSDLRVVARVGLYPLVFRGGQLYYLIYLSDITLV